LRPPTFKNLKERKPDHTNKVELIQKRKKSRDEIVKNDLIMADFDIPTPRLVIHDHTSIYNHYYLRCIVISYNTGEPTEAEGFEKHKNLILSRFSY